MPGVILINFRESYSPFFVLTTYSPTIVKLNVMICFSTDSARESWFKESALILHSEQLENKNACDQRNIGQIFNL
jgi:hypothetical protein